MSAAAAMVLAAALAGCGTTTYFAGRTLPPSGLTNRVLITIQNPSSGNAGTLQFVDAYYDIRYRYNSTSSGAEFAISGYSGNLPSTIQNMPEEETGEVYNSGSGVLTTVNYAMEKVSTSVSGLSGLSSSVFVARNQSYVFAASQASHVLTVVDGTTSTGYALSLPDIDRVSVNAGGSVALAFAQSSNYVYYPRKLTATEKIAYSSGHSSWPKAAVDCEPLSGPEWCLFQAQSPDSIDNTGNYYGAPLTFDHPVKAVFSADGGSAYVLNCGPECGGSNSSVKRLSLAPMIFLPSQHSGSLPTQSTLDSNTNTIAIPGGASNALVDSSTLYVVGQQYSGGYWGGNLTVVNLATNAISLPAVSISDGAPGSASRMILADDDTLWIGMSRCDSGVRAAENKTNSEVAYGCLTMFNTSTNAVTLMPYNGDATGIAAVTGLHKIYTAEGGQVYIYATGGTRTAGTAIDNQNVTVTGTAYDVAYMDALTDSNNTVY
jgi:hypothetical protein